MKWLIKQIERYPVILFLSLAMIILVVLNIFPIIWSFVLSLHRYNLAERLSEWRFVGIQNYINIFFRDVVFINSLKLTFVFLVITITCEFILGLIIALLIYEEQGKMGIARSLILLPMMITSVVVGLIWRFMLNPELGYVNYLLSLIGIKGQIWLGNPKTALLSVIIADIWQWTPFMALVMLAALESIPKEPMEAAYVDGASKIQNFRYVIFPMLKPAIGIGLVVRVADSFKTCYLFFVMTMGGPGITTQVLSLYNYKCGFKFFDIGYAAALSWIMLFMIASIVAIVLWKSRRSSLY